MGLVMTISFDVVFQGLTGVFNVWSRCMTSGGQS